MIAEAGSVWDALTVALNPAFERPRLRPGLVARRLTSARGKPYLILKNETTRTYLRVAPDEYFLIGLIDGERTLKDLVMAYFMEHRAFAFDRISNLITQLRQHLFLEELPRDAWSGLAGQLDRGTPAERAARILHSFVYRELPFEGFDGALTALYRHAARVLFTRPVRTLILLLAILGVVLTSGALLASGRDPLRITGSSSAALASFLLISLVLLPAHEFAHALAVKSYAREVHRGGMLVFYGLPAFFVDSSDIWMEPLRARLVVSAAGVIAVSAIGGLAMLGVILLPAAASSTFLFQIAVAGLLSNLWNLIPLVETDGYYLLLDWLDLPLLRSRSFAFIRNDLPRKLRARERFNREERIFGIFGALALAYSIYAVTWGVYFWLARLQPVIADAWTSGEIVMQVVLVLAGVTIAISVGLALAQRLEQGLTSIGRGVARRRATRAASRARDRLDARELVNALPFLFQVPPVERNRLAGLFRPMRFRPGTYVVREGHTGDTFFVVRRGIAEVVRLDAQGWPQLMGVVRRGDAFGELALLYRQPRLASVRARTDLELLALDKSAFEAVIAPAMEAYGITRRWIEDRSELGRVPLFSDVGSAGLDALLRSLQPEERPAGAVVVREGDPGDAFYVIRSGRVRVSNAANGPLAELGAGAYFGEMALSSDTPRNATVEAIEPVRLWALRREAFDRLLLQQLGLGETLANEAARRSRRSVPDTLT